MNVILRYHHYKKHLIITLLFLSFCSFLEAQTLTISGKVVDENNEPLPGASVFIKGTARGIETDFDGLYQINVKTNDVLVFNFLGYKPKEVIVSTTLKINIKLNPTADVLDEVVVVGYGKQRIKEVTGAVAHVDAEDITKLAVADVGSALQGKIAGVNIQSSSARPGETSNIQIRGLGSVNSGGSNPLFIVDGIPYTNNPNIAPEQIESIDVLKDGASTSVYGVRGANGVILITTKRGKNGRMKIDLNAYTGVQNITSDLSLMNTRQQLFAEVTRSAANNDVPLIFNFNPNALDFDSDFVDEVQNNNALLQSISLNLNGGTENLKVNMNTSYFDQEGVLIKSSFRRIANRLSAEYVKGKFKAFGAVGITQENRKEEPFALFEYAAAQLPWQPSIKQVRAQSTGENSLQLPVRNVETFSFLTNQLDNVDNREINSTNLALNFSYEILKGLDLKVNLGRNTWNFERKWFRPQILIFDSLNQFSANSSRPNAFLDKFFTSDKRETIESVLSYNVDLGKHNLKFTGVLSYEEQEANNTNVGVIFDKTASNDVQVLSAGAEAKRPTEIINRNTLTGKLFRAQYNYDDKYLFSASIRRDGSSRFSEKNRFGNFFGFSAGWNIHEENFFKDITFINNLKLRANWAEIGSQNIPNYLFTPLIESGVNYPFGPNESLSFGFNQRRFVDENIRWETKISRGIGIDASFLDNKLSLTADYYENERTDMLLPQRLPPSTGTSVPRGLGVFNVLVINAGDMVNRGVELALSYKDETNFGLKYNISSTFTSNKNEVTNLNGVERGFANGTPSLTLSGVDFTTFLAVGREAGAFFLVETEGVIKTQEKLDEYRLIDASAQLGDLSFIDRNGDNLIDDNDRVYKGSGQADFEIGLDFNFEYKNFDLYVQNYISQGAEIYNGAKHSAYRRGRHTDLFTMWSPQNPESNIPTNRTNNFRSRSDYFLENGDYWRIRNITLGYTIPGLKESGIDKARVYLSSVNPFTFTSYTGFDPEVGGDGIFTRGVDRGDYPFTRQFSLGVQLSF